MRSRLFGITGRDVSVIGYGAAALSEANRPGAAEAAGLLNLAVAQGVTLVDTADTYCQEPTELHHNERLIARTLGEKAGQVLIATKGGAVRSPEGWAINGRPERLYQAICGSFEALGGQSPIPLWQHHWPDPRYSIAEMLAPARRAQDEGLIRWIGVGNYTLDQLRQACDCVDVVSVQNQYNLWQRAPEADGLFDFCVERNLVFLSWRPLGGPELAHRLHEIEPLMQLATERGVSPQRLLIAWHRAQSPCILPIPGSKRPEHITDCLAAAELELDETERAVLNRLRPDDLPKRTRPPAWIQHPPLA